MEIAKGEGAVDGFCAECDAASNEAPLSLVAALSSTKDDRCPLIEICNINSFTICMRILFQALMNCKLKFKDDWPDSKQ